MSTKGEYPYPLPDLPHPNFNPDTCDHFMHLRVIPMKDPKCGVGAFYTYDPLTGMRRSASEVTLKDIDYRLDWGRDCYQCHIHYDSK